MVALVYYSEAPSLLAVPVLSSRVEHGMASKGSSLNAQTAAVAFGSTSSDNGPCRHYCVRVALHRRQAAFAAGSLPKETASFQDFRSLLVDTSPWMCDGLQAALLGAQQHGCECGGSSEAAAVDIPGGMDYGSVQLWEFLRDFAAKQAYTLEWLKSKHELGVDKPPTWAPPTSPYGCRPDVPDQPRIVIYRCSVGGAADQMKGMMSAFMLALLHPQHHAFVMDCDVVAPLHVAWLPHLTNVSIDWQLPNWAKIHLGIMTGSLATPLTPPPDEYRWPDNPGQFTGVAQFLRETEGVSVKVVSSNAFFGRLIQRPEVQAGLAKRFAHRRDGACSLPPEIWYAATGGAIKATSPLVHFMPKDPFSATQFLGQQSQHMNLLHEAGCLPRGPSLPPVIAVGPGLAAGSVNLAVQLFEFLFRPSPRMITKLLDIATHYKPAEQIVITSHFRIGTAPSDASYADPARDDINRATEIAFECAGRAFVKATQLVGRRSRILWFVATDNRAASARLREMAGNTSVFGLQPEVLELPTNAPTVHAGKTPRDVDATVREEGLLDVYTEMFLLSAGHAILRSRSGFSQLAQGWGRLPIAYQFKPDNADVCEDTSLMPFQTTTVAGMRIGTSDGSLWEFPQVWKDSGNAD
jgi:hypothetical protein